MEGNLISGFFRSIKRVIFFSLTKITTDKDGTKQMEKITTSQALQIAGRAGRYGTQYEDGEVTTFRSEDLPMLKVILGGAVEPIEVGISIDTYYLIKSIPIEILQKNRYLDFFPNYK